MFKLNCVMLVGSLLVFLLHICVLWKKTTTKKQVNFCENLMVQSKLLGYIYEI